MIINNILLFRFYIVLHVTVFLIQFYVNVFIRVHILPYLRHISMCKIDRYINIKYNTNTS